MTADAGDEYDFYPCLVDGAPASIYVNLRYERELPRLGADTRYCITFHMRDAGPHGIGTADEAAELNELEERVIARAEESGLVYVGRIRNRGTWDTMFYGRAGHGEALREAARGHAGGRRVELRDERDADWSCYRELLLPDAERRRWMDDRRLVQVLQGQGDGLVRPRRVDHHAYFASAQARDAFVAQAAREGFTLTVATEELDRERPFGAHVSRTDPIDLEHVHDVVMTLVDAASEHGGSYERWESGIERG